MKIRVLIAGMSLAPAALVAQGPAPVPVPAEDAYYRIETVPIPYGIVLEAGGLCFAPGGPDGAVALFAVTRRGEIWRIDPAGALAGRPEAWRVFASGLEEPMGICPLGPGAFAVAQRPELTRISDTDGDGAADRFETLADAWAYSGHVYEWTFGPVRDAAGNLWGTLATWYHPLDPFPAGLSGMEIPPPAGLLLTRRAAWRGWCFRVSPDGTFTPWASGLRSPNGIAFSPDGDLFVTDNQGEYFGTSPLLHVTRGSFLGHPVALQWDPAVGKDALQIPLADLERRRKPPAVSFPFGVMGHSPSEPAWDATKGAFGPFAGQMFVGDQTKATVMRVWLETVDGEFQGACFPFRSGFQSGNNRLAFAPDGSRWGGQPDRGWKSVGGRTHGLQRVTWTGRVPMEILTMSATREGFDLAFTRPADPATAGDPASYSLQRYRYLYHRTYGSPPVDAAAVEVREARLSADRRRVSLRTGPRDPGLIYELNAAGVRAVDGEPLLHPAAYYTLNRVPRGDAR